MEAKVAGGGVSRVSSCSSRRRCTAQLQLAACTPLPPYRSASALRLHTRPCSLSARSASSSPRAVAATARATTTTPDEPTSTKEKDLVFVAGATGKVGSRAVRELVKLGFRVRAAVRSPQRAASLVQSVEQLGVENASAKEKVIELVECDLEKQSREGIVSAIGNAAVVVCSIGASEKDILDVTGPYRIDYMATNNLVQAATAAGVEHFILVTSLGTNKIGFPAFLLNLFWGVLCWKRRAEEALIASGIPYTIVRPGGMERPTDAFKETHNLVLAEDNTYVGGLVSNLQVAELIACMAKNRTAAYCKVVEVIAETTAPRLPMEDLLARIPSASQPPPAPAPAAKQQQDDQPVAVARSRAKQPLSPYTAYAELKPPSSPSPTPPNSTASASGVEAAVAPSPAATRSRPLSPYTAFVDLKPPSSPSPSPPMPAAAAASAVPSSPAAVLDSNANGTPISIGTSSNDDQPELHDQKQQRPLSPYTRYEELKPPSSPTPSSPK